MKKACTLITAGLMAFSMSYGQNTSPFPPSGNVGIGTTSPTAPLHVQGGSITTGITDIGNTLTAKFNVANPAMVLGVGYVSTDNPFLQAFNGVANVPRNLSINPFGGNVGIGTSSPTAFFEVFQSYPLGTNPKDKTLISKISALAGTNTVQSNTWLVRNNTGNDWYTTRVHDGVSVDVSFQNPQTDTRTWWERDPSLNVQSWGDQQNTYLTIKQGFVGIGTTNPDALLSVNGEIHAKSVKVDVNFPPPDYVFDKKYKIRSLDDVAIFISKNKHLPEIPSASIIKKDGINVSEMNMKLLKKVEELTLYLLEKDQQLKAQVKMNNLQNTRIAKLERMIKRPGK